MRCIFVLLLSLLVPVAHAQSWTMSGLGGQQVERVRVSSQWNSDAVAPGEARVLAIVVDMAPKWHINPDAPRARPIGAFRPIPTSVQVEPAPGLAFGPVQYPEPKAIEVEYVQSALLAYSGQVVFYLPVRVEAEALPGERTLAVTVRYQACDDRQCLAPQTVTLTPTLRVQPDAPTTRADAVGELFAGYDEAAAFAAPPPQLAAAPLADVADAPAGGTAAASLASVLVLAFLGGMVLNIMPCVLPVIPIKILGLVQAAPEPGRRIRLGLAMSLGVLAFWVGLGVVVAMVAGAISMLFAMWWFNLGLGLIIIALGVGMFGLFTLKLPQWVYHLNPRHDSYTGSFGFGVMTAVLATPCTGPFMGAAAGTVLGSGAVAAVAVFFAIGAGMALPYLLLSMMPGLVNQLPRTGPASELVKQVLGLLAVAAGAFFVGTGVNSLLSDGTRSVYQWYWWLAAGIVAAAGLWLAWRTFAITAKPMRRVAFAGLGLLAAGAAVGLAWDATRPSAINWVYYSPEAFDQALAQDKVILLDFTADWCINCKVLERAVLETQPVISALADDRVVAMKADLTSDEAAGWDKLRELERVAIPLLVVFAPDGQQVFKSEFYTVGQVTRALEAARGSAVAVR